MNKDNIYTNSIFEDDIIELDEVFLSPIYIGCHFYHVTIRADNPEQIRSAFGKCIFNECRFMYEKMPKNEA